MMIRTALVFFAVSCMSAVSAASLTAEAEAAISSTTGNGNFIIQLNKNSCINDFVPKFIDHAYEITAQAAGKDLVKRSNKIVRRDTEEEHVHVFDAYNIGKDYKAIGVKFEDNSIIKALLEKLGDQVISIAADRTIQFDLPTLKSRAAKRYFSRRASAQRKGNLDVESLGKGCANGDNNASLMKRAVNTTATEPVVSTQALSQSGAEWGLVRISQRTPVDYSKPYVYPNSAGSSAVVYVVDDGLRADHVDFGGRATLAYSAYSGNDRVGTGHGTHVAGTIGGNTYGVAKKATLVGVKVLDNEGSGQISAILSGLQWVSTNAASQKGKAIINMSLGVNTQGQSDPSFTSLNNALNSLVSSGIHVIAAAGNSNANTCNFLPAGNPNVYAVGATTKADQMASFSNYGSCTNINAPGQDIKSTFGSSSTATSVLSGTSMASPHVAGVAALLVDSLGRPSPAALYSALSSAATKNAIKSIKSGTPNSLLYNSPA
ncbi:Alkaline protease 1 [Choanephora cucurbitarum]|uniref:Alkaline protease 1 n=1 Tax=Choanephora cucurbitarum TaxID=101091 RepID=A0A1C7MVF3_9FUNG|nr:Alkaline protease 1 [Choanephora cucurbitarum]